MELPFEENGEIPKNANIQIMLFCNTYALFLQRHPL